MILTILMFNYIMIIKYENCFKNILNCQLTSSFKTSVFTLKTFPLYSAKSPHVPLARKHTLRWFTCLLSLLKSGYHEGQSSQQY